MDARAAPNHLPAPTRTPPRRTRRALLAGTRLAFLLLLASCDGNGAPRLLSARFADENADGAPQAGETILLTFDGVLRLAHPVRSGVELEPAGHAIGLYELGSGPEPHQLVATLGPGEIRLVAAGISGARDTPDATGISLDFERIGCLAGVSNRALSGRSAAVDVELAIPPPAGLLRAEWLDDDRSFSVSEGDRLRLTWERELKLSPELGGNPSRLPEGLFLLPVAEDRFDDGRVPSRLREAWDRREVEIILGSAPQLGVDGMFSTTQRARGAPSGLAVRGTWIRPRTELLDRFGTGVAGGGIVDLAGDCAPFLRAPEFPEGGRVYHHTATALPDGRVLVVGGVVTPARGERKEVLGSAWIYHPEPKPGYWSAPIALKQPRCLHSATYFPGEDGERGTADDFVLIFGGHDGQKILNSAEVLLPFAGEDGFVPIHDPKHAPLRRAWHTAHALPLQNRLIVVGGLLDSSYLNSTVEELDIRISQSGGGWTAQLGATYLGRLRYARWRHDSLLIDASGLPRLLLFGGHGCESSEREDAVPLDEFRCRVLAEPELLALDRKPGRVLRWAEGRTAIEPRRGHRLVDLGEREERFSILLVGGTGTSPVTSFSRPATGGDGCRQAYRLELDLAAASPSIDYRPAGLLAEERHDSAVVLLASGDVMVAGGSAGDTATGRVELFNPSADVFEPFCSPLRASRESFAMAPLSESHWLIVGGDASDGESAEIFAGEE